MIAANRATLVIVLGLILVTSTTRGGVLYAQGRPAKLIESETVVRRTRINAYPYIYYTPETELAFGAGGIITFYTDTAAVLRPSKVTASGYYSTKGQYKFSILPQVYFARNRVLLAADLNYGFYVDKFWGVGNDVQETGDEGYEARAWGMELTAQGPPVLHLLRSSRVGLKYDLLHYSVTDDLKNPYLLGDSVVGASGGLSSALGLSWAWDIRDHSFWPQKGLYYQVEAVWNAPVFGSDFTYGKYKIDLRHYFGFGHERVIAVQLFGNFASGEAPFYDLPMLGGGTVLRGYYQGRYRDNDLLAAQGEMRIPLFWRFGAVGFAGVGTVANRLSNLSLRDSHVTLGGGLRFRFNQAEKVNLRADVGFGEGEHGVYFGMEEAF